MRVSYGISLSTSYHHLIIVSFLLLLGNYEVARAASVRRYTLWSVSKIRSTLKTWQKKYQGLLRVTTAQKKFKLEAAGGYPNHIITIQDFVAHPPGSASSQRLPEVFWSGALHGDERVGPTATLEAAHLLLRAASCEALPKLKYKANKAKWARQVTMASSCRKRLEAEGIGDSQRQWLARLVTTRRIVVTPTTNAMGYAKGVRGENGRDPNRDFAYDKRNGKCMETIAGRSKWDKLNSI